LLLTIEKRRYLDARSMSSFVLGEGEWSRKE